ncbi:MAG: hypothetical protein KKD44_21345 [Proteobacteria bacterium]|nr:hypothetical protein [Pseudomonadota bacterium]
MYDIHQQKKSTSVPDLNVRLEGIVKAIISAYRNYVLYPEDHALSSQCLKHITSELIKFTEDSGDLLLTIEKDGIYSDSKKFYSCTGEDDVFVYPLIRDGILSLGFTRGIQSYEIKDLFEILKKNRQLPDNPESDIVTDLWQAESPHLHYQAAEVFWDSEPVFNFPNPTMGFPDPPPDTSGKNTLNGKRGDGAFKPGPGGLTYEPSFFKPANLDGPNFTGTDLSFSQDELNNLRNIVHNEEVNRCDDDILDLLLIVLDEVTSSEDLENVLINLAEEFLRVIKKEEAYKAFAIIEKVIAYNNKHAWMRPFVESRVNNFMVHLSGPVFKESLTGVVSLLNRNKPEEIFFFRKICMALESSAVLSLCETLVYLETQTSRDLLMDIIKMKTRENVSVIERMLESTDKMMALIGVSLLKELKDNNSDILLQRVLKHSVEQVRSSALDYFIEKPVSVLPRIFFLVDDTSMDVKIKLLKFISTKRAVTSETLMLNYLKEQPQMVNDKEHLLSCYKVLGKCGSDRSIPFLKKQLFKGSWMGLSGYKTFEHRAGALLALSVLESAEAMKLLKKASKSMLPVVSKAYKMYIE